jgi:hypothetical protein
MSTRAELWDDGRTLANGPALPRIGQLSAHGGGQMAEFSVTLRRGGTQAARRSYRSCRSPPTSSWFSL